MVPKLYYEVDSKDLPIRIYDMYAVIGARDLGIEVCKYTDIKEDIVYNPYKIVVGNVVDLHWYLQDNNIPIPDDIDLTLFTSFMNRRFEKVQYQSLSRLNYPCFIKPTKAKAFDAGVFKSFDDLINFIPSTYVHDFYYSSIKDYKSEWRVYVNNGKILKACHYLGDPLLFPNSEIINNIVRYAETILTNHSYTVDVGVCQEVGGTQHTDLIELNDGYAIGNYGLEPEQYYLFLRDRWLQITGIRKKKDFKI